jgi:hypothetical protein
MSKYLETFLARIPEQSLFPNFEVVLDLNEPSIEDLEIALRHKQILGDVLKLNIVESVVPIGTSMNRCIQAAEAPFLTIWNVDDIRTNFSLEVQLQELQKNPDCGFVYGPYKVVTSFGSEIGNLVDTRSERQSEFQRKMLGGPFMAFSKKAVEAVGAFDEQLKSAADFDLAVRLAHYGPTISTNRLLGYYLNEALGVSTRPGSLGPRERTVIQLRYGIFAKLDSSLIPLTVTYNVPYLNFNGAWHPVSKRVRDYSNIITRETDLMPVFRIPLRARLRKFVSAILFKLHTLRRV